MSLASYRDLALDEEQNKYSLYAITGDDREEERKRLNVLHKALTTLFDYKLLYAPVKLESGDRVLDCGTGTGIWATEAASILPGSVLIDAIDINPEFFPPIGRSPSVMFHTASTFELPPEWSNRFSLVNQRMMCAAFSQPQWEIALREMERVLQPGGWIQLMELQMYHDFSGTHPKYHKFLQILRTLWENRGFFRNPIPGLPEMLEHAGYKNITTITRKIPMGAWGGDLGRYTSIWIGRAWFWMKEAALLESAISSEEFDRLHKEAMEELDEIPGAAHPMSIVYGQKT
ncbi:S-adenosyl-L-methionine-dependent methyltransferase [Pluteus cervinus]|uniref:S-adenosyl-L-methionine-dependent methyltransferase n=1 Tax=Pluteus cervinus TaxID=181527 RepID=A0ACD3AGH0_9AGAR|nr:S-adenosyl-L-methionine-dependent methyltransferase [Pluteus cervinus]